MAISYVGRGSYNWGAGALTFAVPTGYQDDDLFIMLLETYYNEAVSVPSGWNHIPGSPIQTGSNTTTRTRFTVLYKFVSGTQSNVLVADPGDHMVGVITCWRGVDKTNPFNTYSAVSQVGQTAITFPTVTTTVDGCMILNLIGTSYSTIGNVFSAWANASLESMTERADYCDSTSFGGGVGLGSGIKTSAGLVSGTTVTQSSAQAHNDITLALTPIQPLGNKLKVFNGSTFVEGVLKVWNGSAWITGSLKQWNGSEWI